MGVAVGDYDNDGWPDLFVANVTDNQLFHNNGDGTFTDVTPKANVAGARLDGKKMWSAGAGWFDYDNDGRLDLFVVNYCKWEVNKDPYCTVGGGARGYCHPNYYRPTHNTLYRNNGNGIFTDVSEETGIASQIGKGMSVTFADYDGDGFLDAFVRTIRPELLVSQYRWEEFEEIGELAGVAYGNSGLGTFRNGRRFPRFEQRWPPDIWHTAVEFETFPLYKNLRPWVILPTRR